MALNLNDFTTNGNNLTNNGATEYTASLPFSNCTAAVALVAASSQYLSASDSTSLDITGDLTLEAWINLDSQPAGGGGSYTIVSKKNDTGNQRSYSLDYVESGGIYKIRLITSSNGSNAETYTAVITISTGAWHHVAITWKSSTSTANYYLDGASTSGSGAGTFTSLYSSTASLNIGREETGASYFDGKIAEVRVWNTERSSGQISASYNSRLTGTESGLQAYYPFGVGTTNGYYYMSV